MIVIISRTTFDCTLLQTAQRWNFSVFSPVNTLTIVNTLDRKLLNHTSVHCAGGSLQSGFPYANVIYVQNLIFRALVPEHFSYMIEFTADSFNVSLFSSSLMVRISQNHASKSPRNLTDTGYIVRW